MSERTLKKAQRFFEKQNYAQAEPLCLTLLEENPESSSALELLARIMNATMRNQDAMAMLEAGISLHPHHSRFYSLRAKIQHELGDKEAAKQSYTNALQCDAGNLDALTWLTGYHSEQGEWAQTIVYLSKAIQSDPDNRVARQFFANTLKFFIIPLFRDNYKSIIIQCLQDYEVDPRSLIKNWVHYYLQDPDYTELRKLEQYIEYNEFLDHVHIETIQNSLNDPFIVYGLERLRPGSITIENLYTNLRRYFLQLITDGKVEMLLPLKNFIWALSMQCWSNEYAFYISNEEKEQMHTLRHLLESEQPDHDLAQIYLYVYSSYHSPLTLENINKITGHPSKKRVPNLHRFVKKQILNPREEDRIKETIKVHTVINDNVSKMVKDMYEENPYPRWDYIAMAGKTIATEDEIDILSAGCGTGQQSHSYADNYPNAHFMGVDLSMSSLAYAIRQSRIFKKRNLLFEQGDILELDKLDKKYDHIFCTGVLHHMDDPEAGLAVLRNILKPNGTMLLAYYSERARAAVVSAREYIAEKEYGSDADGIRQFRRDVLLLSQNDSPPAFIKNISATPDFYSLSECRDLVFHVQEHRYTIPELLEMLKRQNLEFIEFRLGNKNLEKHFKERFPQESDIKDPMKWHVYEQENPNTFAGMYVFSVQHVQ